MKARIAVAAVCLLALPGIMARADDRKDIEALYAKLKQYIVENKPDAILALETPDFTAKGRDGKTMNGKQVVQQMKMESAGSKNSKMDIQLTKVVIKGKTADVTTSFNFSTEVVDKEGHMGPKGKTHKMAGTGSVHNDLVKTAKGWKFKTMDEHPGKMTMDGKPMDPSQMGGPPAPKK